MNEKQIKVQRCWLKVGSEQRSATRWVVIIIIIVSSLPLHTNATRRDGVSSLYNLYSLYLSTICGALKYKHSDFSDGVAFVAIMKWLKTEVCILKQECGRRRIRAVERGVVEWERVSRAEEKQRRCQLSSRRWLHWLHALRSKTSHRRLDRLSGIQQRQQASVESTPLQLFPAALWDGFLCRESLIWIRL